jgi:WD40 repeat protein
VFLDENLPPPTRAQTWQIADGQMLYESEAPSLTVSPDGSLLGAIRYQGDNGVIEIRQLPDGSHLRTINGGDYLTLMRPLSHLALSEDRALVGTWSYFRTSVQLWSVPDGAHLIQLPEGGYCESAGETACLPAAAAICPDSTMVAMGDNDGGIRLWPIADESVPHRLERREKSPIAALAFSPDTTILASVARRGRVRLWEIPAGLPLWSVRHPLGKDTQMTDLAISPDGRLLVSSSSDGVVVLWGVRDG